MKIAFNSMKAAMVMALTVSAHLFASDAWASSEIIVVNEIGQPIAGAEILIGNALNDPFANNLFTTDVNGTLAIPTKWTSALSLTIEANGYVRTTFANVNPTGGTFQLNRKDAQTLLEVKGQTSHFQGITKDGKVDFGLVFPALTRRQLLQFDVSSMISPETDEVKVLTEELSMPSNLTLPKQKETYILPVTLEKPAYRLYVKEPADYRVVATHGQFPLKQVVAELRNGASFFDVIGYFQFFSGGQRDVSVTTAMSGQDIAVNQVPFNAKVDVTGPALTGTDVLVSIPMIDQGGVFFPSDLKRVLPGQKVDLRTPSTANTKYVASLLMTDEEANIMGGEFSATMALHPPHPQDILAVLNSRLKTLLYNPANDLTEGGLSLAFEPATGGLVPNMIPLVTRPVMNGDRVDFGKPAAPMGITPVATYVILSEIQKPQGNGAERRFRLWELFAEGWVDGVDLPKLFSHVQPGKTYRWEVLFLGKDGTVATTPNGYFLDEVTHLSRNSLDF